MSATVTLRELVPKDVAMELTMTGRVFEAEEALRLGLVTRLAADPLAVRAASHDSNASRAARVCPPSRLEECGPFLPPPTRSQCARPAATLPRPVLPPPRLKAAAACTRIGSSVVVSRAGWH
eukprot:5678167-Prymnesium_polylepis.2